MITTPAFIYLYLSRKPAETGVHGRTMKPVLKVAFLDSIGNFRKDLA